MRTICQNILLCGTAALALSGCSIVVFEDGPDCPAATLCEVEELSAPSQLDEVPSSAPTTDQPEIIAPETSVPKTNDLTAPPLIDGYVTNFAYDSAELGVDAIEHFVNIATFLANKPDVILIVEGHCDERGTREYNIALGERRANAVRDYLLTLGIDANRIKTISYGKERPVDGGHTETAWKKNRRAVTRVN